mmetsp:Transcript_2888/g.9733  ORF Transcript_2888/g.9733 Transcript_2888/m.9733 type:complete len:202 (+) Transcript_2888:698-1303(+)
MATLSICDPLHSPRYGTPLPMTSFLISSISSASLALSISMSPGCLFSSSSFLSDGMLTSLPYGLYSAPRSFPSTTRTPSMPGQDIIIPLLVISSLLTANQVGFELLGSCQGSGNEDGNSSIPLKQIDVVLPDKVNLLVLPQMPPAHDHDPRPRWLSMRRLCPSHLHRSKSSRDSRGRSRKAASRSCAARRQAHPSRSNGAK